MNLLNAQLIIALVSGMFQFCGACEQYIDPEAATRLADYIIFLCSNHFCWYRSSYFFS